MPDNDLRLNSLSRYSKQSSEYVLEVHSHCEVPAGCGGVVLRWRNPHLAIPIEIRIYAAGDAQFFLDGAEPASARPLIPYGDHTFTWIITGFDPTAPVLACSATYDEAQHSPSVTPPTGQSAAILSAPDGSWRYTFTPPPGTWTQPDFDDSAWRAMVERPISADEHPKNYRLEYACKPGGQPLGVEGNAHTVWIRRRFSLVADELKQQEATNE